MSSTLDNQNVSGERVRPLTQGPIGGGSLPPNLPVSTGQQTVQQPTVVSGAAQQTPAVGGQQQTIKKLKLEPVVKQPGFGPPRPVSPVGRTKTALSSTGQVPVSQRKVTVEEGSELENKKKKRGLLKLGLFLVILFFLGIGSTVMITRLFADEAYRSKKGVVFSAPLKTTVWQAYGSVSEAQVELPIVTPNGEIKQQFLLDTGAVVSSLPREMADKMGLDLAFLPRQTFKGFGNTTSFAYQAEMEVNLGGRNVILPVVFTEAGGSKALLGRKGLFDKYTIVVDHKSKLLEIRE